MRKKREEKYIIVNDFTKLPITIINFLSYFTFKTIYIS